MHLFFALILINCIINGKCIMSNVEKFFNQNDNSNNDFDYNNSVNEEIEVKLIKQKSQGLISGYFYNFYRNLWTIKGINGVECDCQLNNNAECIGDARFNYKGQSIRKYFAKNEYLANAFGEVFDELNKLYQDELEEIKSKEQQENINDIESSFNIFAVA